MCCEIDIGVKVPRLNSNLGSYTKSPDLKVAIARLGSHLLGFREVMVLVTLPWFAPHVIFICGLLFVVLFYALINGNNWVESFLEINCDIYFEPSRKLIQLNAPN